jgi:hypothetical protein
MIKFIRKIFSLENLKETMLYISFSNIENTTEENLNLLQAIKNIKNTSNCKNDIDNEKIQIKKAS